MTKAAWLDVPEALRPEIEAFLSLLFRWSGAVSLTAFRDGEEALAKGVVPSLEALPLLPSCPFRALDVGSGGGFPAVPLALARRDSAWTLAEPSGRKCAFLREVSRVLALPLEIREETAEVLLKCGAGPYGLLTVRGVRLDRRRARALAAGLASGGSLFVWTGEERMEEYGTLLSGVGLRACEPVRCADGTALLRGVRP